ncbi:alpha/beta hydrolase [Rubrivivax gelatinosus]|uniref:RBBP9/YdeN family alpha/beta hydrolase n=1 Tax=Rubrivivax gelatinosus TaxID=28068 RepID=UPI00190805E6|nr:alpha/beta hydrolase [Rubrivivax gelatinosus]MBK1615793.1 alpha/beta hydrolase [Rubrivivax gelatinosus]
MTCASNNERLRLLVVPGLHDSGPAHWQTWLESLHRGALRVRQDDWARGDVERWARRVAATIESQHGARWVVAAHSFGCLAIARLAQLHPELPIEAALLVAPAAPERFGIAGLLPQAPLPFQTTLVASQNDPWLSAPEAARWAGLWHSRFVDLGRAGHINADSGFGPLPLAHRWVHGVRQRARRQHQGAAAHQHAGGDDGRCFAPPRPRPAAGAYR